MAATTGISSLKTPTRKGNKLTTGWKLQKSAKSGTQAFDSLWGWVKFSCTGKDIQYKRYLSKTATTLSYTYSRKLWYPLTSRKVSSVSIRLRGRWYYKKKWRNRKTTSPATLYFKAPAAPTLSVGVDAGTGTATFTMGAKNVDGAAERYDTRYRITRQANVGTRKQTLKDTSSTSTAPKASVDVANANGLKQGEYVRISCEAWNRGMRGDSAHKTAYHVFAQPAIAQITNKNGIVGHQGTVSNGGRALVSVRTNNSATRPVDKVQLQVLRSSAASKASEAASLEGWQDVEGAEDDGQCTGLTCPLADCAPDAGTHTFFRLKTTHDNNTAYGAAAVLDIYTPPKSEQVASGRAYLLSGDGMNIPGSDGASALVDMEWDDDSMTGTEVSWSEWEDAWESTDEPAAHDVDWEDAKPRGSRGHSARLIVRGLEESTPYFFKVRRYKVDAEGDHVYGKYNGPVSITPVSAPASVSLEAPDYVVRGQGLPLTWAYDSEARQTEFAISGGGKTWRGADSLGAYTIPARDLASRDVWALTVSITTGGAWVESNKVTVGIVDAPTAGLELDSDVLTAKPLAFTVTSDSADAQVIASVASEGMVLSLPEGDGIQAQDDVVWGGAVEPEWSPRDAGGYVARIEVPRSAELLDGCGYTVSAAVVDGRTGLSAQAEPLSLTVEWAHQAEAGSALIEPDPEALTARVTPVRPEGYAPSDVCDLYRVTPDGAHRITPEEGVAYGTAVTDRWAPYGDADTRYRVATRTVDGDVDWQDVPYTLESNAISISWPGDEVELVYDPGSSESVGKDFESSERMGQRLATGLWGEAVSHTRTLDAALIPGESHAELEALRDLAQTPQPAFVRVPDGCAYAADVQVKSIDMGSSSPTVGVTLATEHIAMVDEYRADDDKDIEPPAWTGGAWTVEGGLVIDADGGYPLLSWEYIGQADGVLYALDGDGRVVDSAGTVHEDWTWDGGSLSQADGTQIELGA